MENFNIKKRGGVIDSLKADFFYKLINYLLYK